MKMPWTQVPVGSQHPAPPEVSASLVLLGLASRGRRNVYSFLGFLPRRINLQHAVNLVPRPPSHWHNDVCALRISIRWRHCRAGCLARTRTLRRGCSCWARGGESLSRSSVFVLYGASVSNSLCGGCPYRHRIRQHRNRRDPRDAKYRIQKRPILRAQPRHVRLQPPRIPRRRNPPPNVV